MQDLIYKNTAGFSWNQQTLMKPRVQEYYPLDKKSAKSEEIEKKVLQCFELNKGNNKWLSFSQIARDVNISRITSKKYVLKLFYEGKLLTKRIHSRKSLWKLKEEKHTGKEI